MLRVIGSARLSVLLRRLCRRREVDVQPAFEHGLDRGRA